MLWRALLLLVPISIALAPGFDTSIVQLKPPGTTAYEWSVGICRRAGFEPDVRYVSTDLLVHLTLVEHGLAAALVPSLSGADARPGVVVRRLSGRPHRRVFSAVRRGAMDHPTVEAFLGALEAVYGELAGEAS